MKPRTFITIGGRLGRSLRSTAMGQVADAGSSAQSSTWSRCFWICKQAEADLAAANIAYDAGVPRRLSTTELTPHNVTKGRVDKVMEQAKSGRCHRKAVSVISLGRQWAILKTPTNICGDREPAWELIE
jgi:hypothetical protein